MIIKDIHNLSITELKQLLARVNHDLKMGKPTIKRVSKIKQEIISEAALCNQYAAKYTGTKAVPPSDNDKLKADIAIQTDILDYLNNGGTIITRKSRKRIKPLTITSPIISL